MTLGIGRLGWSALWRGGQVERSLARGRMDLAELRVVAAQKIQQRANLRRDEAAAYLDVSTKKLQRMEAAGELRRCPGLNGVVRYATSDVLRLASAR